MFFDAGVATAVGSPVYRICQACTLALVMPIVVSESFARTYFPGSDAVGERIPWGTTTWRKSSANDPSST